VERLVLLPDRPIDPRTASVVEGQAVLVVDDRIEALVPRVAVPSDATIVDLSGHTPLPGLIDCHSHLVGEVDSGRGYASLVTRSGAEEALLGVKHAGPNA
jgi:imidazolonepropionase-like amidohydrolase